MSAAALSATVAFESPDFRRFQLGRLLQNLAMQMASVAIGWQVYDLTNSALHLGYVGLAVFAPSVVLALVTGHVADRFDRRSVIIMCVLGQLATASLLVWQATGHGSVRVVYSAAVLLGTCRAFNGPAMQALMPRLVPLAHFPNAVSWHLITFQLGMALGPALGGLIYGATGGATAVFATAGALFFLALVALAAIRLRIGPSTTAGPTWHTLLAGVRYVWEQKVILGAISLDLFAVLLGGAVALLPIFARDILHTGPWGLGFLRASPAVGAGVAALYLAHRPITEKLGKTMFIGVVLFGLATIAFGASTSFALSVVALVGVGASDMMSLTVRQQLVQLTTPDAMRGRVSAVNSVFVGASNELGEFESGVTAAWLGAPLSVMAGGVGTCVVALLWSRLFRQLWHVDRITPVA